MIGVLSRCFCVLVLCLGMLTLSGCTKAAAAIVGGVAGVTILGGMAPTQEIEQVYYLGVFDPRDQLPPTIYRVIVRGQASFLSRMSYASGWVNSDLIDTLNQEVGVDPREGTVKIYKKKDEGGTLTFSEGRKLMLFGPEGFRTAPNDHRLVLVMGSSPEAFFNAIDQALGEVSKVNAQNDLAKANARALKEMVLIKAEQARLDDLERDLGQDRGLNYVGKTAPYGPVNGS